MKIYRRVSITLVSAFVLLTNPISSIYAQEPAISPQEQCFGLLKENMKEAVLFEEPLLELNKMSYVDISTKFSEKKKMLQSFDLTIDQPNLGIRLYSFGRQTGYTHPPQSVLSVSSKSDTWGAPVKEYVIAEEYVTDPQGKEYFLDCVFLQIDSENLMNVTSANYAYDGQNVSLKKISPDGDYKAWYHQSPAFDYENALLATWKRLIIYPKSTQNNYFNRYDVIQTYVANKVTSLDVLDFFIGKKVSFIPVEGEMSDVFYSTQDEKSKLMEQVKLPEVLLSPMLYGINFSYPKASYYQAIENQFPEFGSLLSIQGVLKYNTYKNIVSRPDANEDLQRFIQMVGNSQEIDTYYFEKNRKANPEFDALVPLLQNADETVKKLLAGDTLNALSVPVVEPTQSEVMEPITVTESRSSKMNLVIGIVLLSILFIGCITYIFFRNRVQNNINEL